MAQEPSPNAGEYERLGRYEILGEIASGGMATVFLGRVTGAKGFQRLVAIKRLHPHLAGEEDFVAMFLDEARLAARIRHQNVVATLDVDDHDGLYIVMEYIEGDRLLGLLRHASKTGERIPPTVALRIALDTLAGLHAAHELREDDGELIGLVHRDVSPQNILIGIDGVARLTDFGIAKATSRLTVTRDGQLKGKIAYMAPEQTKRIEIDRRVDLFAMGIITWEMLTSKKLFTGDSDVEVLNQLLFEPIPRLREHAPGLPAALDAAVMKALERDPAKRFSSAAEFADALERASKVFGGAANARAVAAHVQKVAGDKLAKDRAKVTGGGDTSTPSRITRKPARTNPGAEAHETIASFDAVPASEAARASSERVQPAAGPATTPSGARGATRPPVRSTMVGMPAAPNPAAAAAPPSGAQARPRAMTQPGAAVVAQPPAKPPVITPGPALIDDDEDIPTQAYERSRHMPPLPGRSSAASAVSADDLTIEDEPLVSPPITSGPAVPPPPVAGGTRASLVAPPPTPIPGGSRPNLAAPPAGRISAPPPAPTPSHPAGRPSVPPVAHTSPLPPAMRATAPTASLPAAGAPAPPVDVKALAAKANAAKASIPPANVAPYSMGGVEQSASSVPTVSLPVSDDAPPRGRGVWIALSLALLAGGGVATWQFVVRPRMMQPTAVAPVSTTAAPPSTPPVVSAPTPAPTEPAPPAAQPATPSTPTGTQQAAGTEAPAPTPAPTAPPTTTTTPTPTPTTAAQPEAPAQPATPTETPRPAAGSNAAHGGARPVHRGRPSGGTASTGTSAPSAGTAAATGASSGSASSGTSSGGSASSSGSSGSSSTGSSGSSGASTPRPRPSGNDDDPFGSSNPYQR